MTENQQETNKQVLELCSVILNALNMAFPDFAVTRNSLNAHSGVRFRVGPEGKPKTEINVRPELILGSNVRYEDFADLVVRDLSLYFGVKPAYRIVEPKNPSALDVPGFGHKLIRI